MPPLAPDEIVRGLADDHVDAAEARADARLGNDDRRPDVSAVGDVCAAAEFAGPVAEAHHPHDIAVFLIEQVHGALRHGLLVMLVALVAPQRLANLPWHSMVHS